MPITYRIDPERRVVYLEVDGLLSVEEVQSYRRRLTTDPGYSPFYDRMIDARNVSSRIAPADIRRLADIIRLDDQGNKPSRRAVVLQDAAKLGLMQVFQAYTRGNPAEYRVFQSVEDAERWLASGDVGAGPAALPPSTAPGPKREGKPDRGTG